MKSAERQEKFDVMGMEKRHIQASTNGVVEYYGITNIHKFQEVAKRVTDKIINTFLSTIEKPKPILNKSTGMKIIVRKDGILETFGKAKYYSNTSDELKIANIVSIDKLPE